MMKYYLSMHMMLLLVSSAFDVELLTDSSYKLPQGWSGGAAAINKSVLYLINGYASKDHEFQNEYTIDLSSTTPIWNETSITMPSTNGKILIYGCNYVQAKDKVFIISPNDENSNMYVFDLQVNNYKPQIYRVIYQGSVTIPCAAFHKQRNMLYIIGGYSQTYNIGNDTWFTFANCNISREYAGCAFDKSYSNLFLFAGRTNEFFDGTDSIERYCVVQDAWYLLSTVMNTPSLMNNCQLFPYNNYIYCLSGARMANVLHIFNPVTMTMNILPTKVQRESARIVIWNNNCMLFVGGYLDYGTEVDMIEYYGICPFGHIQSESPTTPPTATPLTQPTATPINQPTATSTTVIKTTINSTSGGDSGSTTSNEKGTQNVLMFVLIGISIIVMIGLFVGCVFMYKKRKKRWIDKNENIYISMDALNVLAIPGKQDVYDLLKKWSLGQYAKILIDEKGYDDIEQWKDLNESNLQQIGFKEGHSLKFVKKVKEHFVQSLLDQEVPGNHRNDVNVFNDEIMEHDGQDDEGEGVTNQ